MAQKVAGKDSCWLLEDRSAGS